MRVTMRLTMRVTMRAVMTPYNESCNERLIVTFIEENPLLKPY